jgi:hypothetical protein
METGIGVASEAEVGKGTMYDIMKILLSGREPAREVWGYIHLGIFEI